MDISCPEVKDVKKFWQGYCSNLYKKNVTVTAPQFPTDHPCLEELPLLISEAQEANSLFKLNKSTKYDSIPAALLKFGGDSVIQYFHKLCFRI